MKTALILCLSLLAAPPVLALDRNEPSDILARRVAKQLVSDEVRSDFGFWIRKSGDKSDIFTSANLSQVLPRSQAMIFHSSLTADNEWQLKGMFGTATATGRLEEFLASLGGRKGLLMFEGGDKFIRAAILEQIRSMIVTGYFEPRPGTRYPIANVSILVSVKMSDEVAKGLKVETVLKDRAFNTPYQPWNIAGLLEAHLIEKSALKAALQKHSALPQTCAAVMREEEAPTTIGGMYNPQKW